MRHDHHCPWVGTCVGFGNHKNFTLFIVYTCMGGAFDASQYIVGWVYGFFPAFKNSILSIILAITTGMSLMVSFSLCMMGAILVLGVVRNLTIDQVMDSGGVCMPHPFDQTFYENISEVMGDSWWMWPIPQREIGRTHNGIDYKIRRKM